MPNLPPGAQSSIMAIRLPVNGLPTRPTRTMGATARAQSGNAGAGGDVNANVDTPLGSTSCCYDHREPIYNTIIYGDTEKGVLPAGTYGFTSEGRVINSCTGQPIPPNSLYARLDGPIYGVTMGGCVPVGSQSSVINYTGLFNPLPSSLARKCFL